MEGLQVMLLKQSFASYERLTSHATHANDVSNEILQVIKDMQDMLLRTISPLWTYYIFLFGPF